MQQQALGLIETVGLTAAVEGADAAVKAANVRLLGYELTRGGGMVAVKLGGDVAAVQAAVTAGAQAAGRVGKVVSTLVIPRPHPDLTKLIHSPETVGQEKRPAGQPAGEEKAGADRQEPAEQPETPGVETGGPAGTVPLPEPAEVEPAAEPEPEPEPREQPRSRREGPAPVAEPPEEAGAAPGGEYPEAVLPAAASAEKPAPPEVCNLCGDPACPRRKGEPRSRCIHYAE
ncbi:BMC domain-containing protein [Gelria sp. Kuro-4]|uniref:BMC domain-containing protein n=1 Tax=Gelria sp. Kuro-4 TaxID=2796927 RepID=UPI001BEEA8D1|nr:hypothetical protein kuro4_26310 [Gelria sp. Kuro-4]